MTATNSDHSIIICVHNALADVTACIESLQRSSHGFLEIIVVDDASDEPTQRYIEGLAAQHVVRNIRLDTNHGYSKAANIGLRTAQGSVMTLLNSDTIVPAHWSNKIMSAFARQPEFGILGPLSNAASYQSVPSTVGTTGQTAINRMPHGMTIDEMDQFCEQAGAGKPIPYVPLVHGFCQSISRQCASKVGEFDEESFPRGYGEENDFCIRATDAGFALGVLITTYVFHAKSKSYAAAERGQLMQAGWDALVAKHGKRRLTRSVKIMEQQPVLVEMRHVVGESFSWTAPSESDGKSSSTTLTTESTDIKVIAFYLPQFHPIPFNDKAWGEGFTEWRNVLRARPRFPEHSQPKLPGKLGCYDLRQDGIMRQQASLAQAHGVHGVCMYYYRLSGRRLMEMPTQKLLLDLSIPLQFCFCWANESWTRAWDGKSSDVLLAQNYDDATFWGIVNDVATASDDPRYITLKGRPLFLIYQVAEIPSAEEWVNRLRRELHNITGKNFLIGSVFSVNFKPEMLKFVDLVVQFPPHRIPRSGKRVTVPAATMNPFEPERGDYYEAYDDVVEASLNAANMLERQVLGVCPDWDNTCRRPTQAHTLVGSTPDKFRDWVRRAAKITRIAYDEGRLLDKVMFVNAWNEWAEGAALEPSEKHGVAYLEALRDGLQRG
jgi:GT2 family glycosyltransferase